MNSFWLSGCGVAQPEAAHDVQLDDRLAAPALAEDWAAWSQAWAALDASLATRTVTRLTLCGERSSVTLAPAASSLMQRLARPFKARRPARDWLAAL